VTVFANTPHPNPLPPRGEREPRSGGMVFANGPQPNPRSGGMVFANGPQPNPRSGGMVFANGPQPNPLPARGERSRAAVGEG